MKLETDDGPLEIEVTGLDRQSFRVLVDAHLPRPEDEALWNEYTFPPALIAACTALTKRAALEAYLEWPELEAEMLFVECLAKCLSSSLAGPRALLRRNPRRALELRASMQMGIPLSKFLGWPEADQDLVLAALDEDANRCSCGAPMEDTKKIGRFRVEYRTCSVCRMRDDAQQEIPSEQRAYTHVEMIPVARKGGDS